jgi:hypothetical protein
MTGRRFPGVWAAFAACACAGPAVADDVKELAVLKGPAGPVHWLALSADGSRLASAGQGVVWDVDGQRQVCEFKASAQRTSTTPFGMVWLSADGQTVLTPSGPSFRVWDGKTGKELFAVPALATYGSEFTAVAMSPDGAYLALASNEWTGKAKGVQRQYVGGNITVWDLKAKKVKWKVPGVEEEITARLNASPVLKGAVGRLAFAPDATRLAAAGDKLRVFALDADKEAPQAAVPGAWVNDGLLQWLSGGKAIVLRQGREITVVDPQTGAGKGNFSLNYPRRPAPKPAGNRLPTPEPPENAVPEGWDEHQIVLSADGSRLAAHGIREHEKEKTRNNAVVVWDVVGRKRLGLLKLADDTYNPGTTVVQ